ncbi:hypothetical protein Mal15_08140 [Stieleria maiorica]|uniref:Uncharacterized protein n=1 Tax=Stieleria maiorica TaxID=2795974 RepID=A0A5B9MB57_9BACT|nr:hypothetical protein Mal15_08140 [Stieleria maiorica]
MRRSRTGPRSAAKVRKTLPEDLESPEGLRLPGLGHRAADLRWRMSQWSAVQWSAVQRNMIRIRWGDVCTARVDHCFGPARRSIQVHVLPSTLPPASPVVASHRRHSGQDFPGNALNHASR